MKTVLLSAAITIASAVAATAQPTLFATTNTPLAGDVTVGHLLDSNHVSIGASGPSVTWNFGSVVDTATDTTRFMTCMSTGYCDSFSGANLASFDGSDHTFFITSAAKVAAIGGHSGSDFIHFNDAKDFMRYPFTYNNSWTDTSGVPFGGGIFNQIDSNIADAYGTLILPSGTYTNALRNHVITHESFIFSGFPVSNARKESYVWYAPGVRTPLMIISLDTVGTGNTYIADAKYYTIYSSATSVKDAEPATSLLSIYPIPSTENVHFKFYLSETDKVALALVDLTGRTFTNFNDRKLEKGMNDIEYSVHTLPSGMYVFQLTTSAGTFTQKFVVTH